jgi:probable 2-oxoglutarate dehydrogenase E1 component DHKTD1
LTSQAAASSIKDLAPGTRFQAVLADPYVVPEKVRRIVILSGKLYYDLAKEREARKLTESIALIRVEELCPFPFGQLHKALEPFKNAGEIIWVQEEPRNQGAFTHVQGRIDDLLRKIGRGPMLYRGRAEAATPAPGVGKVYAAQQKAVINAAFEGL